MKLYPFSQVQSVHLKPLLFLSRSLGAISYFILAFAPICLLGYIVCKALGLELDLMNIHEQVKTGSTFNWAGTFAHFLKISLMVGVPLLLFSGILAALVAIENRLTKPETQ